MEVCDTGIFDGLVNGYYELQSLTQVHVLLILIILAAAVCTAIYWFISWILLDKRLNLE